MNFDNLLDSISSGLLVRYEKVEDEEGKTIPTHFEQASEESRKVFKESLRENILKKLDNSEVGEKIVYSYYIGKPVSSFLYMRATSLTSSCSPSFQEVLDKLPKLPENQQYMFPGNTTLTVKMTGIYHDGSPLSEIYVQCSWIMT